MGNAVAAAARIPVPINLAKRMSILPCLNAHASLFIKA
jgi:hypothetical protein